MCVGEENRTRSQWFEQVMNTHGSAPETYEDQASSEVIGRRTVAMTGQEE